MPDERTGELTQEELLGIEFCGGWHGLAGRVLQNAQVHGFDSLQDEGRSIALMHSELSEALEGYRDGNPKSQKIAGFSQVEEELADLVIRVMDHAEARGLSNARWLAEDERLALETRVRELERQIEAQQVSASVVFVADGKRIAALEAHVKKLEAAAHA